MLITKLAYKEMKKGYILTYIKTIVIIIIIIVALVNATNYFINIYDEEQAETIKTNMLSIEGKTKIIGEKVKIKEKGATYAGKKIEELAEDSDIKQLQESGIIDTKNKKNKYYILEQSDVETLGLTDIKLEEGYYIVEYNSNDIIYTKGVKDKDGNVKYKLSEMKEKKQEEHNENNEQENKEDNKKEENQQVNKEK